MKFRFSLGFLVLGLLFLSFQSAELKMAVLKYQGGGDWYANPTSLSNLAVYCNEKLGTAFDPAYEVVEAGSADIFNYPFIHMTGHGNVVFSPAELKNLREYMLAGGFMHIDDNYGMDKFIRPEINRIFPDKELQKLPLSHALFHQKFDFPGGLPKIHEHDTKPAEAFAVFEGERMLLLYTFESDLGDGWEDAEVHNNPPAVREKALQMGANIIQYVFTVND